MDADRTASGQILTIDDLVSTVSLDLQFLAGEAGRNREVLWAHSCEMNNPAHWLGPHELLMTVGLCIPSTAEEQATFIQQLDESGLAGVVVGDHGLAPALSKAMLAEADRRSFPVLLAGAQTPYAVLGRHVAAANTASQTLQVLKLSKLYHLASQRSNDTSRLLKDLAKLLRVGLRVEDRLTGLVVMQADTTRPASSSGKERRYPLRGTHPADVTITESPGEELDGFLLVHLIKVLELNTDQLLNAADRHREISSRAMSALLNGVVSEELHDLTAPHRPADGFHLAAFAAEQGTLVARAIALAHLPVLVGPGKATHLALIPSAVAPPFRKFAAGNAMHVGLSTEFVDYGDVRVAADEAVRALTAEGNQLWKAFKGTSVSVLSRSHREAREIIQAVLGPLADNTPEKAKLRETLFAFLENDRQWATTANALSIHRQTLAYRLKRIAQETDRSVTSSSDVSAFWIAYQAWKVLHG